MWIAWLITAESNTTLPPLVESPRGVGITEIRWVCQVGWDCHRNGTNPSARGLPRKPRKFKKFRGSEPNYSALPGTLKPFYQCAHSVPPQPRSLHQRKRTRPSRGVSEILELNPAVVEPSSCDCGTSDPSAPWFQIPSGCPAQAPPPRCRSSTPSREDCRQVPRKQN